MLINGKEKSLVGFSFAEIGELLRQTSPKQDGVGLKVVLTMQEEILFEIEFGLKIGYALTELIGDAVKASGQQPALQYTYVGRIFSTLPV